jgi:CubicO group peptidase (beta-lactamase class C family)
MPGRRALVLAVIAALAVTAAGGAAAATTAAPHPKVAQALRLAEAWLEAELAYGRIPGMSVGVVVDQELVWSRGLGWADVAARRPAAPDTIYGICSISKLFTAIAVMRERDAGRLRLDDPVGAHLPYFRLEATLPGSPPVTLRDLLTHSGGVPRESAQPYWTDPEFAFPTTEEIVRGLAGQRMLYPAERYYQYSNLGLALLGQVVERTSGVEYETYVRQNILEPLRLASTTTALPEREVGRRLATGYGVLTRDGRRDTMPLYRTRGIAPAAGFASTVEDLAAFASWQFRLLAGGGEEVLKASTLREMQRPQWIDPDWKTTRGLGFWVGRLGETTLVGHSGSCPGYRTTVRLDPKQKLAVIVLVNAMGVSPEDHAAQLMKLLAGAVKEAAPAAVPPAAPPAPPAAPAAPAAPAFDPERFAGLYASAWGETVVVPWDGGLAALEVPTADVLGDLTRLKHVEGATFRRIRADGDDLGEEVVFESDAAGSVTRLLWHQNYSRKVR